MPNPLIGSRPLNTGKRADDRPHAQRPREESWVGDNNPYRGTNDHGVPSSHPEEMELPDWEDTTSGVYEPEKEPVAPIPVTVVRTFARELRRFNTRQAVIPAAGVVVNLVGRNTARSRVTIKSTAVAPATVWIGNDESIAAGLNAFPLSVAEKIIDTEDPVYACQDLASATPLTVYILEEFVVQEK